MVCLGINLHKSHLGLQKKANLKSGLYEEIKVFLAL